MDVTGKHILTHFCIFLNFIYIRLHPYSFLLITTSWIPLSFSDLAPQTGKVSKCLRDVSGLSGFVPKRYPIHPTHDLLGQATERKHFRVVWLQGSHHRSAFLPWLSRSPVLWAKLDSDSRWVTSRPLPGTFPDPTARAPRSPDHVGVLEGLQVPQHRHLADGGERHALLAGLHSHALESHEAAAVLQVAGLEHLPVGALADLRHALILLVGAAQAVLLHADWTLPARHRGSGVCARCLDASGTPGVGVAAAGLDRATSSPAGEKPGAAAAKLRLAEPLRRRRWRAPIPPLPPPQRLHSLPTISAPRRRRREDKEKVRSDSPGDFHRLPPAPLLLPSPRPGPPPGCLILPGFSEKSQVTFSCPAGLVQSSRGEVAGAPRG